MEGLVNLCTTKGLLLVEDVAQAFGSTYLGRPLGSFGLFSVLSFNLFKTVTCGDGGALLTNDRIVFERAYSVHDHGMSSVHTDSERFGPLIGLNFRMTDLSGAVLVAQIGRLPQIRQLLLDRYQKVVEVFRATGIPLAPESEPSGNLCNVVIVTLPTAESAASLASVLGARPLCGSRAHLSWQMQLTQNRLPSMTGRVLDAVPSACPSKDFLERSVAIGIGLGDSYFGIPQIASLGEDCEGFDNSLDYLRRQLFTWRDASSGK
jgi:dTDP-4-amino-4,6-dideoxygalactose transaminase